MRWCKYDEMSFLMSRKREEARFWFDHTARDAMKVKFTRAPSMFPLPRYTAPVSPSLARQVNAVELATEALFSPFDDDLDSEYYCD